LIEDTRTKAASSTTLIANLLNGVSANSNSDFYDHEEFLPADSSRPGPESSERAFLKARSRRLVDKLDSKVGSTEFVTETTSTSTTAVVTLSGGVGWHCKVCDCFLKDSLTYLDHINGRKHQRYLGYSMRAEKSTLDDVKEKLRQIAESSSKQYTPKEISSNSANLQLDQKNLNSNSRPIERIDLSARKEERTRRRQERLKRIEMEEEQDEEEEEDGIDPEIRAMMGFSSFTKGKK
jgi:U4/U6.U5 tri-snRNP component SNU23